MRVEYDPTVDAAYLYLVEQEDVSVASTHLCNPVEVGFELALDFDANGRLVGIEVHAASKHLPKEILDSAKILGH